ncbi:hypothetical protein FPV67DRAFT_1460887 [Lyophyllum atratum]|nr:hypothetical protein FPV67DRAFT_1460887 [Lyophyllum atratum]
MAPQNEKYCEEMDELDPVPTGDCNHGAAATGIFSDHPSACTSCQRILDCLHAKFLVTNQAEVIQLICETGYVRDLTLYKQWRKEEIRLLSSTKSRDEAPRSSSKAKYYGETAPQAKAREAPNERICRKSKGNWYCTVRIPLFLTQLAVCNTSDRLCMRAGELQLVPKQTGDWQCNDASDRLCNPLVVCMAGAQGIRLAGTRALYRGHAPDATGFAAIGKTRTGGLQQSHEMNAKPTGLCKYAAMK